MIDYRFMLNHYEVHSLHSWPWLITDLCSNHYEVHSLHLWPWLITDLCSNHYEVHSLHLWYALLFGLPRMACDSHGGGTNSWFKFKHWWWRSTVWAYIKYSYVGSWHIGLEYCIFYIYWYAIFWEITKKYFPWKSKICGCNIYINPFFRMA